MKLKFYAVKDELANRFLAPVLMNSEAEAQRNFRTQVNTLPIWKENPEDFSLYELGEFNDETGELVGHIEKLTGGRSVKNA